MDGKLSIKVFKYRFKQYWLYNCQTSSKSSAVL